MYLEGSAEAITIFDLSYDTCVSCTFARFMSKQKSIDRGLAIIM